MTKKKLLLRRGTFANLPDLDEGEPGWITDKKILVIGDSSGSEGTFINPGNIVHPEEYGAVGDGTTDDTVALQTALDSLTSGGVLELLPATTYRFTNLTITEDNTTLRGCGWGSVLETTAAQNADTAPIIWVKANGCLLKDFKVQWSTLPTAEQYGTTFEENDVISIGRHFDVVPTLYTDNVVDGVYVYGAKQHGVAVGYTSGCVVRNCRIEEVYGTGIMPGDSSDCRIHDNFIYRTKDAGIDLQCGTARYVDNVTIVNNIVKCTNIAIGSHGGRNVTISDNIIDNTWSNAISCQESAFWGVPPPYQIVVSGNVIRRPFQFYGAGNFHLLDRYSTNVGGYATIEVLSTTEIIIANNLVNDDSGLTTHASLHADGTKVNIIGNIITTDGAIGMRISSDLATDYTNVITLVMVGNNVSISTGNGEGMLSLSGVARGAIFGNFFDCGGQGLASPVGRFLTCNFVKNVVVSMNRVENYTDAYADNGDNIEILFLNNHGVLDIPSAYDTTANIEDVTHAINTANKTKGKCIYNTTTNRYVYANGTAAADVWVYTAGITAHSPV